MTPWIIGVLVVATLSVFIGMKVGGRLSEEPWRPDCPLARAELNRARSISWDYEKFEYHMRRAVELERRFQAKKAGR